MNLSWQIFQLHGSCRMHVCSFVFAGVAIITCFLEEIILSTFCFFLPEGFVALVSLCDRIWGLVLMLYNYQRLGWSIIGNSWSSRLMSWNLKIVVHGPWSNGLPPCVIYLVSHFIMRISHILILVGYGYLMEFVFPIPFRSIYLARTLISR